MTVSLIWRIRLCSLVMTTSTCSVLHSPLPPPLWLHHSLRRHVHANSVAIVSDSDCDSDGDYNPAALGSGETPNGKREGAELLRLWTAQHHQFAGFQLQKAAAPAASLQETGARHRRQWPRSGRPENEAFRRAPRRLP